DIRRYDVALQHYQKANELNLDKLLLTRMVGLAENKDVSTFMLSVQQYAALTHRSLDAQTDFDCTGQVFAENRDDNQKCVQDLRQQIGLITSTIRVDKTTLDQAAASTVMAAAVVLATLFLLAVKTLWNIRQSKTRRLIRTNFKQRLAYWRQLYYCEQDHIM